MGWVSMNRYRQALEAEAQAAKSSNPYQIRFLWRNGPVESAPGSRIRRFWDRHVIYPLIIRTRVPVGSTLHILDHSFADLLRYVKSGVRRVVTLHDLFPLVDPDRLTSSQVSRFRHTVSYLHAADAVVCVSEYTRQEAARLLGLPLTKLEVIFNGVAPHPSPRPHLVTELTKNSPFILSVGSALKRKNLDSLSDVAASLRQFGVRATFVRVGARLNPDLAERIKQNADLIELGSLSDEELSAAYACAAVTFVPSVLEGFGLPVLEAMLSGCPVVHASTSSLSEVAGEAALSYDLDDPPAAAAQIQRLLSDASLRQTKISQGRARAELFSWRNHWNQLNQVYSRLSSN